MKHYELLRECADRLERNPDPAFEHGIIFHHPRDNGKFPFVGGGTEVLSTTESGTNYWVPIHKILSTLAKGLKDAK
jgi:hypothetical protein